MMNLLFLNMSAQELLIVLPLFILFLYTVYHAMNNKTLSSRQRIVWLLLILFSNVLGALAYWVIGKNGNKKIV